MLRIRGAKVLDPEILFNSNIATTIKKEITALEKEYREKNFHVETVGFEARGDGKPVALIKFSFIGDL